MRLILSCVLSLMGCGTAHGDDIDYDAFKPHFCNLFRKTAEGHWVCDHARASVQQGFTSEGEIDSEADLGYRVFRSRFPEAASIEIAVVVHDDYVLWTGSEWAAGWTPGNGTIVTCLWTRGRSGVEPSGCYISRAPDGVWPWWRYTSRPLLRTIVHELTHVWIGDPDHGSSVWALADQPY